ncbi:hypothetical protein [Streptomyces chromofuscus]|uniref:Uncharacterized protein n=1 Tax=Streptomyces chromofuscus TaxID=42881 RepID=A0A7M2T051_STRCW|nr:hypothetical protein [Streptomyces chromofuscus]QOV42050.1 hypothetical protein IPT68_19460 [Streptomyces chromofuscus]
MPEGRNEARVPRGGTRWRVFAAVMLLPGLALAGVVVLTALFALSDDPLGGGPAEVPCSDVLHFGGAELPDGARVVGVCEAQGFQDVHYSATFRMPRADFREWLDRTFPGAPAPETEFCGAPDVDLCFATDQVGPHPGAGAHSVRMTVWYEGADAVRVYFSAFTL